MNSNHLSHELRERLEVASQDVPDRAAIEARVTALLDRPNYGDSAPRGIEHKRRWRLPAVAAAVIIAVLGATLAARLTPGRGETITVDVGPAGTVSTPPPLRQPTEPAGRSWESSEFDIDVRLVVPTVEGAEWSIESDTDSIVRFTLRSEQIVGEAPSAQISLVRASRAILVLDEIVASLFDTEVVDRRDGEIGGVHGATLELRSSRGTEKVGFRIGPGNYMTTSGIDRHHEVVAVEVPDGVLVIWIDGDQSSFDSFRDEADLLLGSLTW